MNFGYRSTHAHPSENEGENTPQTCVRVVINDDLIDSVLDTCKLVAALTIAGIVGAIGRNYYDFNFGLVRYAQFQNTCLCAHTTIHECVLL